MSDQVANDGRFQESLAHAAVQDAPIPWPAAVILIGGVSVGLWAILAKAGAMLFL